MTELTNISEYSGPSLLLQEYYVEYHVGGITLIRAYAPYDVILEFFKERDYREATLAENARFRIQAGRDSNLSQFNNGVKEDILYIPGEEGAFLTKNPAISKSPEKAVRAHEKGREFYPTKRQVKKSLEDAIQIYGAAYHAAGVIPFDEFGSNEITVYAFGTTNGRDPGQDARDAQNYAEFTRDKFGDKRAEKMLLLLLDEEYVNKQKKPFVRKLHFNDVDFLTIFSGSGKDLHDYWVLGVPNSYKAA